MALHSVDKSVNSADALSSQRLALGTVSAAPVQEGQSVGKVVMKDNQIIVNDGTNDRIIIGFLADGF
jgi:hypothetical protein